MEKYYLLPGTTGDMVPGTICLQVEEVRNVQSQYGRKHGRGRVACQRPRGCWGRWDLNGDTAHRSLR